jgi:hypothetical protein
MNLSLLPREPLPECRPYQLDALERGSVAIGAGASSVLLCMPTGTGKTRTAVEACVRHHVARRAPSLRRATPRARLADDGDARARGLEPGHDVFVDTIQGLALAGPAHSARHARRVGRGPALRRRRVERAPPRPRDAIISASTRRPSAATAAGSAGCSRSSSRRSPCAPPSPPATSCRATFRPTARSPPDDLAQDPLDVYKAKAPGSSAVVFCRSVEHAKELAARFSRGQISRRGVGRDAVERSRLGARRVRAGRDLRAHEHAPPHGGVGRADHRDRHPRAALPDAGRMIQAAGRGLRPREQDVVQALDLTGCTHIHGEPDEPRVWHLHGQASTRVGQGAELGIRFCPICGASRRRSAVPLVRVRGRRAPKARASRARSPRWIASRASARRATSRRRRSSPSTSTTRVEGETHVFRIEAIRGRLRPHADAEHQTPCSKDGVNVWQRRLRGSR